MFIVGPSKVCALPLVLQVECSGQYLPQFLSASVTSLEVWWDAHLKSALKVMVQDKHQGYITVMD